MVLDWSLCDVASPQMDVFLTGPEMDTVEVPLAVTLNTDANTATVTESLSAGSYKVRAILWDGETQVAGLVEAVRISNGMTTSGSHTFHFNELGPTTLTYFNDATGTPLKGTLSASGNPETYLDGLQYTFQFAFTEQDSIDTNGLSLEWYYDGNLEQVVDSLPTSGISFVKVVGHGVHRVDAVVYNRRLGSTGSASFTFTVVPNGQSGEMALLNENAAGALTNVDEDTIISPLPGDMFLVTTPNSAKMYICNISSGALQVVKEYNATNFAWAGNIKRVFSSENSNYIIETDNRGGTENFSCLYYNSTSKTLENVMGMRHEGRVSNLGIPFTNFTAASFSEVKNAIYLSDSGNYGFDYLIKIEDNSVRVAGTIRKKSSTYYNVSDMDCSPNGLAQASCSSSAVKFVSSTLAENAMPAGPQESQASSSAVSKVRFLNNQTVVAANPYEFTSFKVVPNGSYTKYKTFGISVKDIAQDEANYFYIADNSKRIVSFSVSGYEITQLGTTTLENAISRICLSGKYLAVLTTANTIALFEVIE